MAWLTCAEKTSFSDVAYCHCDALSHAPGKTPPPRQRSVVSRGSKVMSGRARTLDLRDGAGGPRYYLAGRPVAGGAIVQLCLSGGWVTGRFEWMGETGDKPRFHFSVELAGGGAEQHALDMPDRALLRWPEG